MFEYAIKVLTAIKGQLEFIQFDTETKYADPENQAYIVDFRSQIKELEQAIELLKKGNEK